jgi:hypothetical protein
MRKTRGIFGLMARLRDARIKRMSDEKKNRITRDRENDRLSKDRKKIREKDSREKDRDIQDKRRKPNDLKSRDDKNSFDDIRTKIKTLAEQQNNNNGKSDLKTKLDREISSRQLVNDLSSTITRECKSLNSTLTGLMKFAGNLMETITGLDLDGNGTKGFRNAKESQKNREHSKRHDSSKPRERTNENTTRQPTRENPREAPRANSERGQGRGSGAADGTQAPSPASQGTGGRSLGDRRQREHQHTPASQANLSTSPFNGTTQAKNTTTQKSGSSLNPSAVPTSKPQNRSRSSGGLRM